MKKIYKTPNTEVVNVKLYNTILDDPSTPVGNWSKWTNDGDAKENNLIFDEDDDAFGDIWGSENEDPNDLWN